MDKTFATLLIGLGLAVAPACGRKGPLELPPGQTPAPVEALTADAVDGTVLLRWTNPAKAVSGRPLGPLDAVEIWVFDRGLPAGVRSLASGDVEKTARLARRIRRQEFGALAGTAGEASGVMTYSYAVPPGPSAPTELAFVVRVFDRKGRASDFSAPVVLTVVRKDAKLDGPAAHRVS